MQRKRALGVAPGAECLEGPNCTAARAGSVGGERAKQKKQESHGTGVESPLEWSGILYRAPLTSMKQLFGTTAIYFECVFLFWGFVWSVGWGRSGQ